MKKTKQNGVYYVHSLYAIAEYYVGQQDWLKAAEYFKRGSELKDHNATFRLAQMYQNGWGVKQDFEEAAMLYQIGAEENDYLCQSQLGVCYEEGLGVSKNRKEAKKWLTLAAEKGDSNAIDLLKGF